MLTRKKENNFLFFVPTICEGVDFSVVGRDVVVVRRNSGFLSFIFQKIFNKPLFSYIYLDKIGSFVFLSIDGRKNVSTLFDIASQHFEGRITDVISFCKYMKTLSRCGIVKFVSFDL